MKIIHSTTIFIILVFVSFHSNSAETSTLNDKELTILKHIDQHKTQDLRLLEEAVNINSGTMNFAGVERVGRIFEQEFKALGFDTRWVDGKPFNRSGHLLASYGEKNLNFKGKKLLLIGHLDTVFAKNSDFQTFKYIDKQHVAGPGITDMKGGDVVMISALRALKAAGVLDKLQVRVIMTGDEEKRGSPYEIATKELVDAGKWADIALGFEDGDGNPKTGVISRRGSTRWQLNVTGRAAHSSQIFREGYGDGAIFEAARILNTFRTELSTRANLTFNPGVIVGGTDVDFDSASAQGSSFGKDNVISQSTIVSGDIRALSPQQLEDAKTAMYKIVANNLKKTSAKIVFFPGYPPMAPSEGNRKLLALYSQTSEQLGFGSVSPVDPRKAGAADISFVANHVDMALDGLGLMGVGGHTIKEVADITTLTSQSKRVAILMYRLSEER